MKLHYFHGGAGGLRKGQYILPPTETGYPSASDYGAAHVHRRDRVYLTTDKQAARVFASLHPSRAGDAYEVEPEPPIEPDPDCTVPGLSFQCPRARILRTITGSIADLQPLEGRRP